MKLPGTSLEGNSLILLYMTVKTITVGQIVVALMSLIGCFIRVIFNSAKLRQLHTVGTSRRDAPYARVLKCTTQNKFIQCIFIQCIVLLVDGVTSE